MVVAVVVVVGEPTGEMPSVVEVCIVVVLVVVVVVVVVEVEVLVVGMENIGDPLQYSNAV